MEDLEFKAIESGKRLRYYKQKYNLKNKDLVGDCKSGLATSEDKVSVWYNGGQIKNGKRSGQLSPKSIYAIIKRIIEIRPEYPKPRPEYLLCEDNYIDEIEYQRHKDFESFLAASNEESNLVDEITLMPERYIFKYMQLEGYNYQTVYEGFKENRINGNVIFTHNAEKNKNIFIPFSQWESIIEEIKTFTEFIIKTKILVDKQ